MRKYVEENERTYYDQGDPVAIHCGCTAKIKQGTTDGLASHELKGNIKNNDRSKVEKFCSDFLPCEKYSLCSFLKTEEILSVSV